MANPWSWARVWRCVVSGRWEHESAPSTSEPPLPKPGPPSRSRGPIVRSRRFSLQVHLRGQLGLAYQVRCAGLAEAIHFGEAEFLAFAERNLWIGLDSLQHKIWILLDPGTESTR
jgi:hypothetical protein